MKWTLSRKLIAGFATMIVLIVCVAIIVFFKINEVNNVQKRVLELRQPTVIAGKNLLNGINDSLASLRGYMILGKDKFRKKRANAWKSLDVNMGTMKTLSKNWTDPNNIQLLNELQTVLEGFRKSQKSVEDICRTPENQPALVMLLTQAAPRARKMLEALTGMIDAEDTLAANRSRKSLLKALADSRGSFATGLASIRAYLLSGDVKFIKDFNNRWETNSSRFSTIKNSRNIFSSEQVKFFKIYESVRQEFEQLPDEMFRIRGSDKWNQGIWLLGNEAAPRGARAIIIINGMIIGQEKLMLNDVNTLKSESNSLVNIVIIVAVIGLIFGIIIAWSNIVSITKPLKRVISNLSEGSDIVVNASEVVSSGAQSLAEDASSQAAAIEETSSSIEEMAAMTKNNAANASEANSLMKNAKQIVSDANDSMGNLTGSMEEISKASEETSKIIKTIDEIAFQTNLLALNAAVEAARAGEAGAGFAVVADEVRNLALRAADAAKNTASLIEGTVKKINDGSILVTETNEAFEKMAENTGKVGGIVGEITAASSEQAEGISQINKAIAQMDSIVQRNAASAEESASGSEELSAQAAEIKVSVEDLKGMIGSIEDRQQQAIKLYGQPDDKNVQQKIFATKKELVKAKEISPEQVIPMHDDDFEDF